MNIDTPSNMGDDDSKKPSGKLLPIILGVAMLVGLLTWQQIIIFDLNKQFSDLKSNQLPAQKFTNFDNCMNSGGIDLYAVNAPQFGGCLGGNVAPSKEDAPEHQVFLQYSAQNLPRIDKSTGRAKIESRVDGAGNGSTELVNFLKHDESDCSRSPMQPIRGYYKIRKEIPNRFALLNYGCTDDKKSLQDKNYIIAIKLGDGWSFISPTNEMREDGTTGCLLVDMFKVSKQLTPRCFEDTGFDEGALKNVTYP